MFTLVALILFFAIFLVVSAIVTDEPKELPRETNLREEFKRKNNIK